jgi:hypothetical protein
MTICNYYHLVYKKGTKFSYHFAIVVLPVIRITGVVTALSNNGVQMLIFDFFCDRCVTRNVPSSLTLNCTVLNLQGKSVFSVLYLWARQKQIYRTII